MLLNKSSKSITTSLPARIKWKHPDVYDMHLPIDFENVPIKPHFWGQTKTVWLNLNFINFCNSSVLLNLFLTVKTFQKLNYWLCLQQVRGASGTGVKFEQTQSSLCTPHSHFPFALAPHAVVHKITVALVHSTLCLAHPLNANISTPNIWA